MNRPRRFQCFDEKVEDLLTQKGCYAIQMQHDVRRELDAENSFELGFAVGVFSNACCFRAKVGGVLAK